LPPITSLTEQIPGGRDSYDSTTQRGKGSVIFKRKQAKPYLIMKTTKEKEEKRQKEPLQAVLKTNSES
jgi:hypothetical protein